MTHQSRTSIFKVREEPPSRYALPLSVSASKEYLEQMVEGLLGRVARARSGQLARGIQLFRKPEQAAR